jgi:hypothetical protein
VSPRGVPDTRRQCAKADDQWAQGAADQQNPLSVSPTLQPLVGWLRNDTLQEVVEGNPKLKVSGGRTPWPAGHHLACYQLNQVGNPSLDPYKYPLPVEINATHTTCSSPLVNVLV